MAIKNNLLGGTDWASGELAKAEDLNDTFDASIDSVYSYDESSSSSISLGTNVDWVKIDTITIPADTLSIGYLFITGIIQGNNYTKYMKIEVDSVSVKEVSTGSGMVSLGTVAVNGLTVTSDIVIDIYARKGVTNSETAYSTLNVQGK